MNETLEWEERRCGFHASFWEVTNLPLWTCGLFPHGCRWHMWIVPRPPHCDRGRYLLDCDAPLDCQEAFPRYYFSLDVAKTEAQEWVNVRRELR